ncbi:MAG: ABC transporter substrate-binding protein [Clostridia bacterium]|nr:ABC transporter substrate-binding protein [Clostridia bacterium]
MKKFVLVLLSFLLALSSFAFVGCSNGNGKNKVRLCEVTHSIFYAPLYVAINNGYFDEVDIEIELTNGGGADKVMSAISSKSADIGLMGPEATIYCQAQGQRDYPIIFGQLTKRDGSFLVSKTEQPDFKWTDLRGKHVLAGRIGGVPAMTMQYVVNNAGLNEKTDLRFNTDVAFNMMAPVFESDDRWTTPRFLNRRRVRWYLPARAISLHRWERTAVKSPTLLSLQARVIFKTILTLLRIFCAQSKKDTTLS